MKTSRLMQYLLPLASLTFSAAAMAAQVTPVGYTYDVQPLTCGTYCNYHDVNHTKLTDGVTGNAGWEINQGQEWVGWVRGELNFANGINNPDGSTNIDAYGGKVNIDFDLGQSYNITSITIGSTQDNNGINPTTGAADRSYENVVLPNFYLYQLVGGNWQSLGQIINPVSAANNTTSDNPAAHSLFTFDLSGYGGINNQYFRVTAENQGLWVFIDEVTFTTPVPEPDTYAMLLLGMGALVIASRRKKRTILNQA